MKWRMLLAVLVTIVTCCAGCATTQKNPNDVSTIPWNRPAPWEGAGALGGFGGPGAPGTPGGY